MSSNRLRQRRASFSLTLLKHDEYINATTSPPPHDPPDSAIVPGLGASITTSAGSVLTPDVAQSLETPFSQAAATVGIQRIGNYLLQCENTTSSLTNSLPCYDAVEITTGQEFTCKVLPLSCYRKLLTVYCRAGSHPHIISLQQVVVGSTCVYAFFPRHHGDLHSYVRSARRLKESETAKLFRQIVSVVDHCHSEGIVLRDLKLRKFVFKDSTRTELMLESLDDACVLDSDDDMLSDRHGCPAYVSPEILSDSPYSGRAADVWSLGVILFTMLLGRYPFHDADPVALFRAIRHVRYVVPRGAVSDEAQCLLRWLLHADPNQRPAACEVPAHPWFRAPRRHGNTVDTKLLHSSADLPSTTDTVRGGGGTGSASGAGSPAGSTVGAKLSDCDPRYASRCCFVDQIVPDVSSLFQTSSSSSSSGTDSNYNSTHHNQLNFLLN
jgi:tribbles-like protein